MAFIIGHLVCFILNTYSACVFRGRPIEPTHGQPGGPERRLDVVQISELMNCSMEMAWRVAREAGAEIVEGDPWATLLPLSAFRDWLEGSAGRRESSVR